MDASSRRLLFYVGPVGFCVELKNLVEIVEQVSCRMDVTQGDAVRAICASLPFRQALIPVVDLSARLGLPAGGGADTALVLNGPDGCWALLVDRVMGVYPAAEMSDRVLPRLLMASGWRCFERLGLLDDKPYLHLDLAACYSGGGV